MQPVVEFFKNKYVLYAIIAIVLVIVLVWGYKEYKKLKEEGASAPNEAAKDEKTLSKKYTQSYNNSYYASTADVIHESLKYGSWLSSWENDGDRAEAALLSMKNDLDVAKLITAFGKRSQQYFGFEAEKLSLFELCSKALKESRITKINTNWSAKGITYLIS